MGSIILGTVGAAAGAAIPGLGPVLGGVLGRAAGATLGGIIDNAVFGVPTRNLEGSRLADLSVQFSTYGKTIPLVYGNMRIAGNVIWSRPIKETATTSTTTIGGGKGVSGGGTRTTATTYSYSISLAIALCEGEIEGITRVWADSKLLDLSQGAYRLYRGTEDQLPDPFIESFEGTGNTPAYRGLAYVVIEDFPLADFGNRIPNFTFEVKKPVRMPDYQGESTEEMVTAITLIPGAGEFVYDTIEQVKVQGEYVGIGFAQSGFKTSINRHTPNDVSNVIVSLDQLQVTCPNLQWVSVVVTWFGDSLNAADCLIKPGVEYQSGAMTEPDNWGVAGYSRSTARQITLIDGTPRYGGTPADASLIRLLGELRNRGYQIMLYPMFFMDAEGKPWRGRVTGSASDVAAFFTKPNGYDAFIHHYINLAVGRVDAFVIGSELIGLTKVAASPGNYPAVNALVNLAAYAKTTLGSGVKVTYAADWSEYHHTDGGWYNLDPLWASPHIDVIGIDAYFPLTDEPQSALGYDITKVMDGWDSGEGYNYYYADAERTDQQPLAPAYAWKNIEWFWNNIHYNPGGIATAWVPQSKKIWFTEYGFPSVDAATNQPNVFYDPASVESFFPRQSRGIVDFRAQRTGITGTEARWKNSPMIERKFLWTWDARPYPYFPDLREIWADGGVWAAGHWVTGKFGMSGLAAIVRDICLRAGLMDSQLDVSRLTERVDGYIIARRSTARQSLEELMAAYFFDAVEHGSILTFIPRGTDSQVVITAEHLVREPDNQQGILQKIRTQEVELPQMVEAIYLDRIRQYQSGTERATRQHGESRQKQILNLPLVMSASEARIIAEKQLYHQWLGRIYYRFSLDIEYMFLEPSDVITVVEDSIAFSMRIVKTLYSRQRIEVQAVAEEITLYEPVAIEHNDVPQLVESVSYRSETVMELLDIPALPQDNPLEAYVRIAVAGAGQDWSGAVIYRAGGEGDYQRLTDFNQASVMGRITAIPAIFYGNVIDYQSFINVRLLGEGELFSVTMQALLNGANAALIGEEVIQFMEAQWISPQHYRLTGLLRGRLGTEDAISSHILGERFILLDSRLGSNLISYSQTGIGQSWKAVSIGQTLGAANANAFTFQAKGLLPYAPVHLQTTGVIGQDITFTWVRRDRLYGEWRDGRDIGLSETSEHYEVDIIVNNIFKRTLASSVTAISYTIAMQIADGVVTGDEIMFRVCQISSLAGRGKAANLII